MESTAAITSQLSRIAEAMDAGDYPTLRILLARATLIDGASGHVLAVGGDAAVAHFASIVKLQPDGTWGTKHVTTNPILEFDRDDLCRCRSMYTVLQQTDALPMQPIISGRYHDTYACMDSDWHLTERRYFADLVGDVSHHITLDL